MAQGWLQIAVFLAVVLALTRPLGAYMARVYRNERVFLDARARRRRAPDLPGLRVDPSREQDWKSYARTLIVFSASSGSRCT